MGKTLWTRGWVTDRKMATSEAGERSLIARDGGAVEQAGATADNTAMALCRLVEILHDGGKLSTEEVQQVLDMYGYEVAE